MPGHRKESNVSLVQVQRAEKDAESGSQAKQLSMASRQSAILRPGRAVSRIMSAVEFGSNERKVSS